MQATDSYLFSLQKEYLTFETLLKKGKLFNNPLQYIFQNEAVIRRIKNPYLAFLIGGDKMFFHAAENACSAQRKVFPLSSFSKHTLQTQVKTAAEITVYKRFGTQTTRNLSSLGEQTTPTALQDSQSDQKK